MKTICHYNPLTMFQTEKDNIIAFLNQTLLNKIIKEISGLAIKKFLDNLLELTICTITLLLQLPRPIEAMEVADAIQGLAYHQEHASALENFQQVNMKEKFQEIQAIVKLMKAGFAISQNRVIEKKDALKEVKDAESLFSSAKKDSVGVGEALYLHAVLLLSDKEEYSGNLADLKCAKEIFDKENKQICLVRVLIAESMLSFNQGECEKAIELLNNALKIIKGRKNFKYLKGQCFLERAKNYKLLKKYDEAGEDLRKAQKKFLNAQNMHKVNECERMISLIAEEKQKDCPLFAFLKAFPIVKKKKNTLSGFEPIEPNIRQPSLLQT